MKKALYIGLKGSYGHVGYGLQTLGRLIVVTSEKRTQAYGRTVDGEPTHCRLSDIVGRFDDLETAKAAIGVANQVHAAHQGAVDTARQIYQDAERRQREAVASALELLKKG